MATALEDLEDCSLDHGITEPSGAPISVAGTGACTGSAEPDSVDADDGVIDGLGGGNSWFGPASMTFTFASPVTAAGLVWTDGAPGGDVLLRCLRPGGALLGTVGPFRARRRRLRRRNGRGPLLRAKNPDGIGKIRIRAVACCVEVDHIQYGSLATLFATWDTGRALQAIGAASIRPSTWAPALGGSAATVTTPDASTVVLTYDGLDPNETLQINVASFGPAVLPADPFKVVGNQIQVEFDDGGTMATLTIDVASSSGGLLDPGSLVGFNPQPEPPAAGSWAFDPPPSGDSESVVIQVPLSEGAARPAPPRSA